MPKDDFVEHVLEQMESFGVVARSMFGGYGLYRRGIIFGLIADGELYFKVDGANQHMFEEAGSKPFIYAGKDGKPTTMSYWELPESVLEDQHALKHWMNESIEASVRTKGKAARAKAKKK